MVIFNAVQLTALFAGWPFFINWLTYQQFPLRDLAIGVAVVAYFFSFIAFTSMVADNLSGNSRMRSPL